MKNQNTERTTASEQEIVEKCKFLVKLLRVFKMCRGKKSNNESKKNIQ
jgi:hypothetical protein